MLKRTMTIQPSTWKTLNNMINDNSQFANGPDIEAEIQQVYKPRFITYGAATEVLGAMESLLTRPSISRPRNMIVPSVRNNGKTSILEKFIRDHPRTEHPDGTKIQVPILSIQGTEADEKRFYKRLLGAVEWPFLDRPDSEALRNQTLRMLRELGVKMIIIDEFHSLAVSSANIQRAFLAKLKTFCNEIRIPMVVFGTSVAGNTLRSYEELDNRFRTIDLPEWTLSTKEGTTAIRRLLTTFQSVLPLQKTPALKDLTNQIFLEAAGNAKRNSVTFGELWEVVEAAAVGALRQGLPAITKDVIAGLRVKREGALDKGGNARGGANGVSGDTFKRGQVDDKDGKTSPED